MSESTGTRRKTTLRLFLLFFCWAMSLWSTGYGAQETTSTVHTHKVRLVYEAETPGVCMDLPQEELAFRKEPAYQSKKPLRGVLRTGSGKDVLGYAWDVEAGKLYLDRNRNLDLTDDSDGVVKAESGKGTMSQNFEFQVDSSPSPLTRRYSLVVSLSLVNDASPFRNARVRSGWQGKLQLGAKTYTVTVADNLDGRIGQGDALYLQSPILLPKKKRCEHLTEEIPLRDKLFLDGQLYSVDYVFASESSQTLLAMTLKPQSLAMGSVVVQGKSVSRLVLKGDESTTVTVVLDEPASSSPLAVPAGKYYLFRTELTDVEGNQAYCRRGDRRLEVKAGEKTEIGTGAPLKNLVNVARQGLVLEMSYHRRGLGEEDYEFISAKGQRKPSVSVSKDGSQLVTGEFEYG